MVESALAVLGVLVIAGLAVGFLRQSQATGTVTFMSGGTGYLCFLNYSGPRGGPLCLQDGENTTVPWGEYPIVFFATKVPQDTTFNGLVGDGGVSVGNWTVYSDPFSFTANMTVTGDGSLGVLWVYATPVPEFPGGAIIAVAALVPIMLLLRRRT